MITTQAKTATPAQAWRDRVEATDWGAVRAQLDAYGCALTGPLLTPQEASAIPQFVPAGAGQPVLRMLALSAVFMVMTFVVFALYGGVRRLGSHPVAGTAADRRPAAPHLRRLLRRPWGQARPHRALNPPGALSRADPSPASVGERRRRARTVSTAA